MSQLTLDLKCPHYWIYESPNGRTSKGTCKYCGVECKGFNSLPMDKETDSALYSVRRVDMIKRATYNSIDGILEGSR